MQNYPIYPQYQQQYMTAVNQTQQRLNDISQMYPQYGQAPQQASTGLIWVQGDAGAKSYLVAPGSTVLLMDSDSSRFYIKSADNAGMPSLRTFDYKEVSGTQESTQTPQAENLDEKFVTRTEYESLKNQYEQLSSRLSKAFGPAEKPKRNKEVDDG